MALIKILKEFELVLDTRTVVPINIKKSALVYAAEDGVWIKLKKLKT